MWRELIDEVTANRQRLAVLCGAGISQRACVPLGSHFQNAVLGLCLDETERNLLTSPALGVRFEGLLEIVQAVVDPELKCVELLEGTEPTSEHHVLAHMATRHVVLTTNFDVLIEKAAAQQGLPDNVRYRESDFREAPSGPVLPGLWKLHGTASVSAAGRWRRLGAGEDGGAVATLMLIARTRESKARRQVFERVIEQAPLVVIGYSGSDDFDISRWLMEAPSTEPLLWVQWS